MAYYGVLFPEFWTGRTGRDIRREGGVQAQLLALYLTSNRHANMLGLYRLALADICHETGMRERVVIAAAAALERAGFARFDASSDFVWVLTMCLFRLGLKTGHALEVGDKRVVAVNRLYHGIEANPFLGAFYMQHHEALRLDKPRPPHGQASPYTISGPLQGASKPLASQSQISGSGSDLQTIRDQGSDHQEQEKAGRFAPDSARRGDGHEPNVNVITRLAHDVIASCGESALIADLADALKTRCAELRIALTPDAVTKAIDSALHQRQRRRA